MARRKRSRGEQPPTRSRLATLLGVAFLLVEVVILPGAASPFRLVKEALLVGALSVLASAAAALAVRRGQLRIPSGPIARLLLLLPLLQATSLIWSSGPTFTVQTTLTTAMWTIGVLWMATLSLEERRRLALWASAGVAISSLALALQSLGIEVLTISEQDAGSRRELTGLTGNPADLAMAAALLLPLTLDALSDQRGLRRWGLPAVLASAVVLSQTWTGYAALAAITVAWMLGHRTKRTLAALAAAAVLIVAVAVTAGLGDRLEKAVTGIAQGNWYGLLSARGDGWTAAVEMIRQRPVLGVGAGCYTHDFYPSRLAWLVARDTTGSRGELATHFRWAHCDPLQLAAELGLPGILWAIFLAVAAWRHRRSLGAFGPMMVAAGLPFALLHYPHHLAVGLLPIGLAAARLIHDEPQLRLDLPGGWMRRALIAALALLAVAASAWQLQRLAVDVWRGSLQVAMQHLDAMEERPRQAMAAALEQQIVARIDRLPSAAPWLWRRLGIVRLGRGDHAGAEAAFRQAQRLWPHEETDLGLGLALAGQGRRAEALVALARVCRVNPQLARYILDPGLHRAVFDVLAPRRGDVAGDQ